MTFADRATSIPAKIEYHIDRAHSYLLNGISRYRNPDASAFYNELNGGGYNPNALIDALAQQKLIYINVPKCASTSIKMILSSLVGRRVASFDQLHKRIYSGLRSPFQIGVSAFHRLATDSATLRFSFVRNPMSGWFRHGPTNSRTGIWSPAILSSTSIWHTGRRSIRRYRVASIGC